MVILAVPSSKDGGLNDKIDAHFGKCASFTFIEIEGKEIRAVKTVPNTLTDTTSGPGVQASNTIKENNAKLVITEHIGVNAAMKLNNLKIKLFQAPEKSRIIKKLVTLYIEGKLKELNISDVKSYHET